MKKIISVLTALLVLAALLCPAVSAAGSPTFEVSSCAAARNEAAEITISIKDSPGITSAKLKVEFDPALVLKTAEYGDTLGGMTQAPQKLASPVTLNWINPTEELKGDALYATLTFAADSKAAAGDYKITVSYDENDVYNIKEENVKFNTVDGKITLTGDPEVVLTGDVSAKEDASKAEDITGDDGNGDYIGGEVRFDEEGNVIEEDDAATVGENGGNDLILWLCIAAAVLIVAAGAVVIIAKKKGKAATSDEAAAETEDTAEETNEE